MPVSPPETIGMCRIAEASFLMVVDLIHMQRGTVGLLASLEGGCGIQTHQMGALDADREVDPAPAQLVEMQTDHIDTEAGLHDTDPARLVQTMEDRVGMLLVAMQACQSAVEAGRGTDPARGVNMLVSHTYQMATGAEQEADLGLPIALETGRTAVSLVAMQACQSEVEAGRGRGPPRLVVIRGGRIAVQRYPMAVGADREEDPEPLGMQPEIQTGRIEMPRVEMQRHQIGIEADHEADMALLEMQTEVQMQAQGGHIDTSLIEMRRCQTGLEADHEADLVQVLKTQRDRIDIEAGLREAEPALLVGMCVGLMSGTADLDHQVPVTGLLPPEEEEEDRRHSVICEGRGPLDVSEGQDPLAAGWRGAGAGKDD